VNRSLLARTKREFYDDAFALVRQMCVPEAEIEAQIADDIRVARALLDGKCPYCGAPSTRYIDYTRQQGASRMPGTWVSYRCSTQAPQGQPNPPGTCDFMVDLKEGEASN